MKIESMLWYVSGVTSQSGNGMQEVKILTTALPAEYGHSGGGIMNISYKGGTNQYPGNLTSGEHGTAGGPL